MRLLSYTLICLFGTTLAMPVQSQGAQALSERQNENYQSGTNWNSLKELPARQDAGAAAGAAGDGVASGLQAVANVGNEIASGV
ncbi:uncharacterized protein N7483_009565 [Penicillium malachiteum]|uniref:uncharacterized protein n=1 Tax=Penicillium malachiteum TaxID=1324776 RepID=UPI00254995CE|nr:uncharacterized protein N7483_009565 [Penicillium malachiteum]KAJ5721631.1 hypothetical protein N7483_009565 [Penicillium malachiteum]